MAFNLLVELHLPNWESINKKLLEYSDFGIEFFPIAISNIIENEYLGLSIINGNMTDDRAKALRAVLVYLLENKATVFELYSSSQVSVDNMELFIEKFFY